MKQNGFRLVQRKFAQGVPIPASSATAAPTPPERKADPAFSHRNVYHNNMSARSLLDIVAMQNIHRHKQPMVLLERLREDEIPAPPAPPKARVPLRKRSNGLKSLKAKNNNMCLRSGKRKSPEAVKGALKKRKKLSSESTDDIPLMFLFTERRKAAQQQTKGATDKEAQSVKEKGTPAQKRGEQNATTPRPADQTNSADNGDGRFTFKEPSGPIRLKYRLYKRKTGSATTGRPMKKIARPKSARWSTLRSARAASETSSVREIAKRAQKKLLTAKKCPKPAAKKSVEKPDEDEAPQDTGLSAEKESTFVTPEPPPSECNSERSRRDSTNSSIHLRLSSFEDSNSARASVSDVTAASPAATPTNTLYVLEDNTRDSDSGQSGWCIREPVDAHKSLHASEDQELVRAKTNELIRSLDDIDKECVNLADEYVKIETIDETPWNRNKDIMTDITEELLENIDLRGVITAENDNADKDEEKGPEETTVTTHQQNVPPEQITEVTEETSQDKQDKVGKRNSDKVSEDKDDTSKNKRSRKKDPKEKQNGDVADETNKSSDSNAEGQKAKKTRKGAPKAASEKKTNGKRAVQKEPEKTTRLLRNMRDAPPPPTNTNPDVYEFNAELEATGPPSGLRARRPTLPPPADAAPEARKTGKQIFFDVLPASTKCVQLQKNSDLPKCPTASLVNKDVITTEKKKALIENLSSSPTFLDKFLNCLSPEIQTELDNLIAAEQASGDTRASTSHEEQAFKQEPSTFLDQKHASGLEAPTFYPTAEEFADPIKYYDKIAPQAARYGLCKIVPPESFKPPCNMSDTIRFAVIYQYISKMYSRWGPVSRELAAIKAHLRTQSVVFARSPLLDGREVNLPKLYHAVERNGGLSNVIQRKRWGRVADEMKLTKLQHPERKLDPIYMRYLLPYATLSDQERQKIMSEVERCWTTKYQKMLERARNPFQRQNRMLSAETESESDDDSEDGNTTGALHEAEDCIVQGRTMNLATFKKIASSLMDAHFEPTKQPPSAVDVETAYWRAVLLGTEHIVANTASIDTGEEGYGFPKDQDAEYGKNPWNLKELGRNPHNVLRYLGPVLGVTVPTLHLSMLFSTSCWHRDPHGLPWTEYMHSGAEKIWYGIPKDESINFRRAVETLCPAYCQNKSIWLASEITMVPPNILSEHGVRLSRLIQRPGEYVMVFPEAHSCSITTGFAISESVYFASNTWLADVYKLFQELRNSCEPTMFSLEQLLVNGSKDPSAPQQVCSVLCTLLSAELEHRRALEAKGLKVQERPPSNAPLYTSYFRAWNAPDLDECEYCRSTLYLSKVTGLTGRKSAVCPEHAFRLLETKKYKNVDLSTLEFLSSYSTSALEEMLEGHESRNAEEAIEVEDDIVTIDLTDKDSVAQE